MAKLDSAQINNIVREVMELVIDGQESKTIVDYIRRKHNRQRAMAFKYIKAAHRRIGRLHDQSDEERAIECNARYDKVWQMAKKAKQLQVALNAVRAKAKLNGTDAPTKLALEASVKIIDVDSLMDEFDAKNKEEE